MTRDSSILDQLPRRERDELLASATVRSYEDGEVLFWEGDPGDSFCILTEGKVIIEATDPQGNAITLAVLAEGEAFGEQSLLKDEPVRTATARALGVAHVISVSRTAFDVLRLANPVFDRFLLDVLTERVDRLSALVLEMAHLPAEERVLRRIAYLAARFEPAPDGSRMLPLSQEQWANLAGTTRVTVNRALRRLEHDGTIEIRRGGLLLHDLTALDSGAF